MYNNQVYLKKHTALTVSHKDVDTSFIFFPVRLETRFVENHPVEDVSEPDKVLYAFKALWHYVEALRHNNSDAVLLSRAKKLMERVEGLDTVYREDRTRLKDLSAAIVEATKPSGDLAKVWERIQVHIPRLATLDVICDNDATEFLRKLDRVDRTIRRMAAGQEYNGKLRRMTDSHFSQSAKYKRARNYMKSCLPVLEQLLPEDPKKSIVNRFSHITKRQMAKFVRVMKFFEIGISWQLDNYLSIDHVPKERKAYIEAIINGSDKGKLQGLAGDFGKYVTYRNRYLGGGSKYDKGRKQSLHDKMQSKVGRYHHYTLFAEKMILWSLRMATTKRDIATPSRVKIWRELAASTIFSYHEERTWLLQVLDTYNDFEALYFGKEDAGEKRHWWYFDQYHRISPTRLNKNNRFIRNRKLRYVKHSKCLLIRVYPDTVAVTQMARGLSADEILHARLFWVQYFHAKSELEREAAWKSLCAYYAPPRAAFIARKQFPNKLDALKDFRVPGDMTKTIMENGYAWLDRFFPDLDPVSAKADTFPVPITELMPDRFIVQATLDNGNQKPYTIVQYGRLIPKSLQVGLDMNNAPDVEATGTGLKLGGNLRWMTDYSEAEQMGLAITIPLDSYKWDHYTRKQLAADKEKNIRHHDLKTRRFLFSSIYVTGVKEFDANNQNDSRISAKLLQDVFNAHLYGDEGLELLKIGTPTNILDDQEDNSTFNTGEEAQIKEFYKKSIVPLEKHVRRTRMGSDADLLSYLFGIAQLKPNCKDNPFLNTANRENSEVLKQRLVNDAFLNLVEGSQTNLEDQPILRLLLDNLKNYFVYDVSPSGVFPSFRIGDQPYGIVPVCDFKNLKFRKGDPLYLVRNLMLFLADKWNDLAENVVISEQNMYQSKGSRMTTEERYLQAVGGTPYSTSFYERKWVEDPELLDPAFFDYLDKGSEAPVATDKMSKEEREARKKKARDDKNKGIQKEKDYLLHSIRTIVAQLYPTFSEDSMVAAYFPDHDKLSVKDTDTTHPIEKLDWGFIRNVIWNSIPEDDRYLFKDDEELNRYITGTFDLFNYRLDAWLTGLLHKRLYDRMHVKKNHKVSIGAYGWVFNLKEDKYETASDEFIVAPSVNQAVTAAVLRSSFNRSAEGSTQDYSLNVNLSSSRVRQALRIIDGVRNGLSVGAVLGSDLERALHEEYKKSGLEMDYFIYFLRQAYPLSSSPTASAALKAETNANADKGFRDVTIDVLNGSALIDDLRARAAQKYTDSQKRQIVDLFSETDLLTPWLTGLFQAKNMIEVRQMIASASEDVVSKSDQKIKKLISLIQEMEDAYDALADVITSESVYKLTQGNRDAVDALMNSLQTGRNIPDPEVTEIPLTSAHIEQRVFVALNTRAEATSQDSIMQQAEPSLDQWMGQVLGFDRLAFPKVNGKKVSYVSLAEIGVTPSELVYLSGDWERFQKFLDVAEWFHQKDSPSRFNPLPVVPGKQRPQSELEKEFLAHVISLEEAEWAVDSMREMLSKARELRQNDLIASTEYPDDSLDRTGQMDARYDRARASVAQMAQDMKDLAAPKVLDKDGNVVEQGGSATRYFEENPYLPLPNDMVMQLFRLLFQSFRCGVLEAINGVDPQLLLEKVDRFASPAEFAELLKRQQELVLQVGHISDVLRDRIAKADAVRYDENDPSSKEAIKKLLLSSFWMIQPFRVDYNPSIDTELLEKQMAPDWFGKDSMRVLEETLTDLSDVRTQLNALHQIRLYAQWNGTEAAAEPRAMQIDTAETEPRSWLGAQVEKEEDVHDANVYTVLNPSEFMRKHEKSQKYLDVAGLMIDFWVEKIPYRRQTAAVAFGYDQPDAEPPQAILVGVSTLGGNHNWSQHRMIRTIRSAMHQIKSRAVEPEHLYADEWTSSLFPILRINPRYLK